VPTTKRCPKCGSTKVREINLEMAFARGIAEPVYALGRPLVCFNCGFAECRLPDQTLHELSEGVPV
jgi:predicted nucleic-acid-binding Zn-ribbon protein